MESRAWSTEVKPQTHPLEHTVLSAHTPGQTLWEALVPGRWLAHSSSLANSSWQAQSLFAVGSVFALTRVVVVAGWHSEFLIFADGQRGTIVEGYPHHVLHVPRCLFPANTILFSL